MTELVPPDAFAAISSSALAQCRTVFAGLLEPARSLETEEETRPPRPSQLAFCLEVFASLVDYSAAQQLKGCSVGQLLDFDVVELFF